MGMRSWQPVGSKKALSLPRGVQVREGVDRSATISIRFVHRGIQCREWSLPATDYEAAKLSIETAKKKLESIRLAQQFGTFRYGEHFPESKNAQRFGEVVAGNRSIEQALREWLDGAQGTVEDTTYEQLRLIVENALIPRVGKKLVTAFTALDCAELVKELGGSRVGKTVRNILNPLRGAFDREVMARFVVSNPVRSVRVGQHLPVASRKHQTPLAQPYNEAERSALLAAACEQMANMMKTWWGTGMAEGEILGLHWPDLDFVNKKIRLNRVMDKTGRDRERMKNPARHRYLKMDPEVEAALIAQKKFSFLANQAVFLNPVTGARWSNSRALTNSQWRTISKRAGVLYRGPNQCRHTYAAIRITRGDNLWEIASDMGQRGPEMLYKHYGAFIREREERFGARNGDLAIKK